MGAVIGGLLYFGIIILLIVSQWKVYVKMGRPGWNAIIPIYNIYVLLELSKRPTWYLILLLVPLANIFVIFTAFNDMVKGFGKDVGFTIGLIFLPFVFWPMLAFGDATFKGMQPIESDKILDL